MKTIHEPGRQVPIRAQVDVVVCGGGVSGCMAALAAARNGARTLVIEGHGFLGGVLTAALVNGVGGWQFDLDGEPLIGSIPLEAIARIHLASGHDDDAGRERMARLARNRGGPGDYRDGGLGCYWVGTNPEAAKFVYDQMMAESGVQVLLHTQTVRPIVRDGQVGGVFVENKNGCEAVLAQVVIDCTGDGDIAVRAGADYDIGRPEDAACQPMTMMYTVGNAPRPQLWFGAPEDDPESDPLRRNRFSGAVAEARERGIIEQNPNDLFCAATPVDPSDPSVCTVNFTRVQGRLASDADALSAAEIEGRAQVQEAIAFQRAYIPGHEQAYLINTAAHIGIRESRRIRGDYSLTGDEVLGGAHFDDAIARGIYLLDIHNPAEVAKPSALILLDQPYSIPYRCLLPVGLEGLLVAGRCISGDHLALASYRVQSHAMALGQAAGTAAALSVREHCLPRQLDPQILRNSLREAGANVGDAVAGRTVGR